MNVCLSLGVSGKKAHGETEIASTHFLPLSMIRGCEETFPRPSMTSGIISYSSYFSFSQNGPAGGGFFLTLVYVVA